MFSKKKYKKIKIIILTIFFLSSYGNARALTIADLELLIAAGLIPAQNIDAAREFVNSRNKSKTEKPGSLVSTSPKSTQSCLIINQNLIKGRSGSLIIELQKFLKLQGYFPEKETVTGFYGDTTVKAVTDFQVAQGLIKNSAEVGAGTLGPITRAKIQEVSCKELTKSQTATSTNPVITSSTTTRITNLAKDVKVGLINSATKKNTIQTVRPPKVVLDYYERYLDPENGKAAIRYDVVGTPKELARYLEGFILCDSSSLSVSSKDIKKCGDTFIIDPIKDGKKSFSVQFDNSSRFEQSVTFAVEVFNELKESIGISSVKHQIPAEKPIIKLDVNNNIVNQRGSASLRSRNCSFVEQLDFLRYTMSPYNPNLPVSLPVCWPGEILCNQSNPPTYCRIKDGPNSDDLCPLSQIFFEGRCVPRQ